MDTFMCYGPVVPDGYGVCYNPHPHDIIVCISAFKSFAETQSDYFAYTLEGSLLQMQELCYKISENTENGVDEVRKSSVSNGPVLNGGDVTEETAAKPKNGMNGNALQGNGHYKKRND